MVMVWVKAVAARRIMMEKNLDGEPWRGAAAWPGPKAGMRFHRASN